MPIRMRIHPKARPFAAAVMVLLFFGPRPGAGNPPGGSVQGGSPPPYDQAKVDAVAAWLATLHTVVVAGPDGLLRVADGKQDVLANILGGLGPNELQALKDRNLIPQDYGGAGAAPGAPGPASAASPTGPSPRSGPAGPPPSGSSPDRPGHPPSGPENRGERGPASAASPVGPGGADGPETAAVDVGAPGGVGAKPQGGLLGSLSKNAAAPFGPPKEDDLAGGGTGTRSSPGPREQRSLEGSVAGSPGYARPAAAYGEAGSQAGMDRAPRGGAAPASGRDPSSGRPNRGDDGTRTPKASGASPAAGARDRGWGFAPAGAVVPARGSAAGAAADSEVQLTPEEWSELNEISDMLKEAADRGSFDSPSTRARLGGLLDKGSLAVESPDSAVGAAREKLRRLMARAGRALTKEELEDVLAAARSLGLSRTQAVKLLAALRRSSPPSPGTLAAPMRGVFHRAAYWHLMLLAGLGLLAAGARRLFASAGDDSVPPKGERHE